MQWWWFRWLMELLPSLSVLPAKAVTAEGSFDLQRMEHLPRLSEMLEIGG
jgi:hypothetical protein